MFKANNEDQNDTIGIVLVSLLLTLKMFYILF